MLAIILTGKMGLLHWNARRLFNFLEKENNRLKWSTTENFDLRGWTKNNHYLSF